MSQKSKIECQQSFRIERSFWQKEQQIRLKGVRAFPIVMKLWSNKFERLSKNGVHSHPSLLFWIRLGAYLFSGVPDFAKSG
jgi:hypothetical protein